VHYHACLYLSQKESMMSRFAVLLSVLATVGFTLALSGCGTQAKSPPSQPAQPEEANSAVEHEHGEHAEHAEHAETAEHEGHSEYEEALAQLSEADRALAEKQKICPVSGNPLGSMGKPYKVTVKGQEVFLCCPGCEDAIKKNPDEYLAKLGK
jgi:YHS domain-containing protein